MWNSKTITEFWQSSSSSFAGESTARAIRYLSGHLKRPVLDVGAGNGALLRLLPQNSVGIDIVPRSSLVRQGNIDNIRFPDGYFGTVFAADILEHLTDDTLYDGLKEVSRVLRPGGRFILTVPNQENLRDSFVHCPACSADFHRWGHVQVFSKTRVTDLLKEYNFVVRSIRLVPLGLMGEHWLIRYFWPVFVKAGFVKASDLFVIAEKR